MGRAINARKKEEHFVQGVTFSLCRLRHDDEIEKMKGGEKW